MEDEIVGDFPCSSRAVDSILRLGTAGLIWGLCSGPRDASKLGLTGTDRASLVAKSAGRFGFQWGLFAGIFTMTRCGVQKYRQKNDWMNALVAGAVAGAAIGASTRNWKQVTGMALLASSISAVGSKAI